MITNTKLIGYWKRNESDNSGLPWPIEGCLPEEIKSKVVDFLKEGVVYRATRGWSDCRLCGKMNGSTCMKNGPFIYPEGYVHYILDHNILPDADLLNYILDGNFKTQ